MSETNKLLYLLQEVQINAPYVPAAERIWVRQYLHRKYSLSVYKAKMNDGLLYQNKLGQFNV